jgi:hypothetical protein
MKSERDRVVDRLIQPLGVKLRIGKILQDKTVIFFQQGLYDRSQIIYLTVGKTARLLYGY